MNRIVTSSLLTVAALCLFPAAGCASTIFSMAGATGSSITGTGSAESVVIDWNTLFVGATDGVTEARNEEGELFGMDRFVAAAVANRALGESELVKAIMETVQTFCSGRRTSITGSSRRPGTRQTSAAWAR